MTTPLKAMLAARRLVAKPQGRVRKQSKREKLERAINAVLDDKDEMMGVAWWSAERKNGSYDNEIRALAKYLRFVADAINSVPAKSRVTLSKGDKDELKVLAAVATLAKRLGRPVKMAEMARHVAKKFSRNPIAVKSQLKRINQGTLRAFNGMPNSSAEEFAVRLSTRLAEID